MDDGATFLARFVNGGTLMPPPDAITSELRFMEISGHWFTCGRTPTIVKRLYQGMSMSIPQRFKATEPEKSANFTQSTIEDKEMEPNFQDGLRNQEILEAVETSARDRHRVDLPLEA